MITQISEFSEELKTQIGEYNNVFELAYKMAGYPQYNKDFNKTLKRLYIIRKKLLILLDTEPQDLLKESYIKKQIKEGIDSLVFFDALGNS